MSKDSRPSNENAQEGARKARREAERVQKLLYSKTEAAFALGVSKRSIEYLISGRKLDTRRIGTRVLIPAESLRRFARANHFETVAS